MAFQDTTSKQRFSKPLLSFSIERILSKRNESRTFPGHAFQSVTPTASVAGGVQISCPTKLNSGTVPFDLPWLSYTRYSPPKVPRTRKPLKRKTSGNPRVPFSTSQIITLENKYMEGRYLSGPEVLELSNSLNLSEHRVKIWFQNRRAREKKTQVKKDQTSSQNEVVPSDKEAATPQHIGQKLPKTFLASGLKSYRWNPCYVF